MKRQHKPRYENLWWIFPVLWKHCTKCQRDFRFEHGWQALVGPWLGGLGHHVYLCRTCAPTREDADKYFLNKDYLTGRPKLPPNIKSGVEPRKD